MDRYQFTGNIGQEPEVKPTANGKQMVTFSVAIDKSYKDQNGQKVSKTKWVSCVRFVDQGKPWGVLPYLKKGTKVLIEGEPEARAWINATSGEAQGALSVNVRDLELVGSAPAQDAQTGPTGQPYAQPQAQQPRPQAQPTYQVPTEPDPSTDDLPF
jgi:single-strand DNA-binding protein